MSIDSQSNLLSPHSLYAFNEMAACMSKHRMQISRMTFAYSILDAIQPKSNSLKSLAQFVLERNHEQSNLVFGDNFNANNLQE